ncbi:Hypothetical predicted protein [Scomber scombrus]|uniref:Uncharacterized protein n=1 Tax=Scomber scombrus TaxID=13677 RepID=A0AAV1PX00_SCOSC
MATNLTEVDLTTDSPLDFKKETETDDTDSLQSAYDQAESNMDDIEASDGPLQFAYRRQRRESEDTKARYKERLSTYIRQLREYDHIEALFDSLQSAYDQVSQEKNNSSGSSLEYKNRSWTDEIEFKKKPRREESFKDHIEALFDSLWSAYSSFPYSGKPPSSDSQRDIQRGVGDLQSAFSQVFVERKNFSGHSKQKSSPDRDIDF